MKQKPRHYLSSLSNSKDCLPPPYIRYSDIHGLHKVELSLPIRTNTIGVVFCHTNTIMCSHFLSACKPHEVN